MILPSEDITASSSHEDVLKAVIFIIQENSLMELNAWIGQHTKDLSSPHIGLARAVGRVLEATKYL